MSVTLLRVTRWREVDRREAAGLERELARELSEGHVLHGRVARAVAVGGDGDDVAFEVDGVGLFIVHLTWRIESDPRWPWTTIVDALPETDADEE